MNWLMMEALVRSTPLAIHSLVAVVPYQMYCTEAERLTNRRGQTQETAVCTQSSTGVCV